MRKNPTIPSTPEQPPAMHAVPPEHLPSKPTSPTSAPPTPEAASNVEPTPPDAPIISMDEQYGPQRQPIPSTPSQAQELLASTHQKWHPGN
mmetsp:Transcript_26579/g.37696  ORF Transcript_26579/g.37696 Transcript_26579/m.37696 type:complete len:91 (+) Transcript_26579:506-778(+)